MIFTNQGYSFTVTYLNLLFAFPHTVHAHGSHLGVVIRVNQTQHSLLGEFCKEFCKERWSHALLKGFPSCHPHLICRSRFQGLRPTAAPDSCPCPSLCGSRLVWGQTRAQKLDRSDLPALRFGTGTKTLWFAVDISSILEKEAPMCQTSPPIVSRVLDTARIEFLPASLLAQWFSKLIRKQRF